VSNRLAEPLGSVLDRAPPTWAPLIEAWRCSVDGLRLETFVAERQVAHATIYPAATLRAFELTPRDQVRVVIVGQDPYHGSGQAEGLAFSVPTGVRIPPSLRNVFKELQRDLGLAVPVQGHLGMWARRGVLLLNTSLTVEEGRPGSHASHGWEALTDEIIKSLSRDETPRVFMLWGTHAQAKAAWPIASGRHLVLMANHPSPLSALRGPAPFLGCGHFSAANRFLAASGSLPIDWAVH
jgi:uracil-DNA glycosylase